MIALASLRVAYSAVVFSFLCEFKALKNFNSLLVVINRGNTGKTYIGFDSLIFYLDKHADMQVILISLSFNNYKNDNKLIIEH